MKIKEKERGNKMELTAQQLNLMILAALWALPWKGVALWKAAQNKHKWWFIALLVVNTLAILEIIYIFYFSKKKEESRIKDN
ncbi:MAG: hypothetical protein Athens101410_260 [Parcubacteria group bacterium Athens1014_10]|nr:MAG: hypothetical protein Athens101410_260 [Parcubacteria group bacterium Athens1014_10]TSD05001.1 MAG: hypothetical protein Athens071412_543 [Parcubacteria group bacterium Athens0714_12]